jgi:hypothetical protein
MSKKNSKGVAPVVEGTENTEKKTTVEVIDANKLKDTVNAKPASGLDANHQVDMLMGLKTYFKDDPNAKNIFGEDVTNRVNNITAIGFISVLTNEVLFGKSEFAARMSVTQRQAVIELAPLAGVTINPKLLPAPDADGTAVITSNAVTVSEKTQKAAKKEKAIIDAKPELNPTKITNDAQLAKSLIFVLSDTKTESRPAKRMERATELLRSYQLVCAEKTADEAEKKTLVETIKSKTISGLLDEVRELVGECPFTTVGLAHYIYRTVGETKSPVMAYCLLRNASKDKATGKTLADDTLAAVIRVLIKWSVLPNIAEYEKAIAKARKDYKDDKAFESYTEPIMKNLNYCKSVLEAVNNPDTSYADTLLEKFNAHDAGAKSLVRCIAKTFYSIDSDTIASREDKDELLNAIQQHAGIIINLFRDPLAQDIRYVEANLTYSPKEETTEEAPKN